jgi:hypothetical protein
MKTICGHDREVLLCALQYREAEEAVGITEWCEAVNGPEDLAYKDLRDPVKLAKMLAHVGSTFGFSTEYVAYDKRFDSPADVAFYANEEGIVFAEDGDNEYAYTPAQARAILRTWLDLGDGKAKKAKKAKKALKALRGEE